MNSLNCLSKEFNANNISKTEYTISLIKECIRCEILPKSFLYEVQVKIGDILKKLILKYTQGQSTSVTVEKAEKLIISIWYTVDAYLSSFTDIYKSIDELKNTDIKELYLKGRETLEKDFIKVKKLYQEVLKNKVITELSSYNDTILDINNFFENYNLDFETDEVPCSIDYPLIFDDWDINGLYYIKNYLWELYIENEICNKFRSSNIEKLLIQYGENYKIDYRDLLINIFELTIINSIFASIFDNNTLLISEKQYKEIDQKLKQMNDEDIKKLITYLVDNLIKQYDLNNYQSEYIKKYQENIIKDTIYNIKRDNLNNYLVINKEIHSVKNRIKLYEGNKLSNEEFRLITEKILAEDDISLKIDIIKNNIHSIKDYIDILRSDCLFDKEFFLLFESMENIELAILGKYVFYGEYNMENLDLLKLLQSDININYQWEAFYLEYLKLQKREKLICIQQIINDKL